MTLTYPAWAASRHINAAHPDTWSPEDHAAYDQWKLAIFREKWMALKKDGTTKLMRPEQIRSWVRESLDTLARPAPSRRWRSCECHMRPRQVAEDRTPVRHGVAWLTETFGRRRSARAGKTS
jgi:hypothetical protein